MTVVPIHNLDVTDILNKIHDLEISRGSPLSIIEKILLTDKGSMEQILSVILNSELIVKVTNQKGYGNKIEREVILTKNHSDLILLYAQSIIYKDNVPQMFIKKIEERKEGIGKIILQLKLETFKQITKIGFEDNNIFRIYNVIFRRVPFIRIKEVFFMENINSIMNG